MNGDSVASCQCGRKSFPPDGRVAQSRVGYQNEAVETKASRPSILVFVDPGRTATALRASNRCVIADIGLGPCVDQIRQRIVSTLQEALRFLIDSHWHFDHADWNVIFTEQGAYRLLPPRMDHHLVRRSGYRRYSLGGPLLGVTGACRSGRRRRGSLAVRECGSRGRSLRVLQIRWSAGSSLHASIKGGSLGATS
jgi:glyoxylase-like metal-dependent hydrolase (beta-lactamase superfamily II)